MAWTITTGPEDVRVGGYDGTIWRWRLADGERTAVVLVKVTGTAMGVVDEALPERTVAARATHGRSEAERCALWFEPPRSVQLSTWGDTPSVEGGSRDSPGDAAALEEIFAWFAARGVDLVIEEVRDGWDAVILRPGFTVGGWGATRLEAARNARVKFERAGEPDRRDVNIEASPAAATAAGIAPEVLPVESLEGVSAKAELPVESIGVQPDIFRRLEALAARASWLLAFVDEPDGSWRYLVIDAKTLEVLDTGLAGDWDDAKLSAIENLYPPSEEGLGR